MTYNKRFSLRVKILDGLLRKRQGVSMKEILRVINDVLECHGICPVLSKDTIFLDMDALSNEYHVDIMKIRDKFDNRVIRYRYENLSFSIFNNPLRDEEIKEIKEALDVLSSFRGLPQCGCIDELCVRFDVACETNGHKVVQFEESCMNLGMEHFSCIFRAIIDQKAAVITYKRFGHDKRQHKVFPYYLKQFDHRWYLVARSTHHLESICIFSLDRLLSFEEDPETEYIPIGIDIDEYFKDVCGITRPDHGIPITIRFYVNATRLPYLMTNPIHQSQVIRVQNHIGAILTIRVIPTPELLMRFLSLGKDVRIITSCQLRREVVENCKRVVRMYGSST